MDREKAFDKVDRNLLYTKQWKNWDIPNNLFK